MSRPDRDSPDPVVRAGDGVGAPSGLERCYTADPFGNQIELIDARDAGFTEREG